jgi:hypothetical protein
MSKDQIVEENILKQIVRIRGRCRIRKVKINRLKSNVEKII